MRSTWLTVIILFLITFGFFYLKSDVFDVDKNLPANVIAFGEFATVREKTTDTPNDLVVVGDIMLARYVSEKMNEYGSDWPFISTTNLLSAGTVIGNFEAAIPVEYKPTPNFGMTLSVSTSDLAGLVSSGITHLSLANNHSYDDGQEGYDNTLNQLELRGFEVAGNPNHVATSSISYVKLNNLNLAVVNINATYSYPEENEWLPIVSEAVRNSDLQMVYIHWGDEYELVHNSAQEKFAYALIDNGMDMIVGTHPHVVQDIASYNGGMIFYSLGNFIFDQNFSEEVQEGLVLHITAEEGEIQTKLIPVETKTTFTQPREMQGEERVGFLNALASRSQPNLAPEIASGLLSLQF